MKTKTPPTWVTCLLLFATVVLTYCNVVAASYGLADDYTFLESVTSGKMDLIRLLVTVGRATQAGLVWLFFSLFSTVESLRYMRLIGIIGIGLFACCLFGHIRTLTGNRFFAACAAYAICALPSFQVYAAWSQYFSMPYACIAAYFSYQLAERGYSAGGWPRKALHSALAIGLLLLALTIHQVAGFFFVFFLATTFLHEEKDLKSSFWHLVTMMSVFGISLIVSYVLLRLGKHWFPVEDSNRDALASDVLDKIRWFVSRPLYDGLSLSFIPRQRWAAIPNLLLIMTGIGFASGWKGVTRLWKTGILMAFLPLAYLPNLVVAENWSSYRTQAVLASLLLYLSLYSIHAIVTWRFSSRRVFDFACALVAASFGLMAHSNVVRFFSVPQALEYKHVKKLLAAYVPSRHSGIHYVMSCQWDTPAPFAAYDEFGLPSSAQPWVPKPMIKTILHDWNIAIDDNLAILKTDPGKSLPERGFLLDFSSIKQLK